jgi:Xaa-Pro aminopeptidase
MTIRLDALRQKMAARKLDALLVTQPANIRYLSSFTGGEDATLFVTSRSVAILTDFRYVGMVKEQCPDIELVETSGAFPMEKAVLGLVQRAGGGRVGFEGHHLTYNRYRALRNALLVEGRALARLVPVPKMLEEVRAAKAPEELAIIERAVLLTDAAFNHVFKAVAAPGAATVTEAQVAWQLERYMREHGGEGTAFNVAVAAGPNSAVPHHQSGDRPLKAGEPIWIDMGARIDGYCSDLTRTFCLGEADARYKEIYALVLRAQLAAEAAIRPGVTGRAVDAVARGIITEAGYGEAFRHGTGHGVGLEIHELPRLGLTDSDTPLIPGNVVTVEPGIYLAEWGGIRIEDTVAVMPGGCHILTTAKK